MTTKIVVTGASGLLGRTLTGRLKTIPNCSVEGWSWNRAEKLGHLKVDLTNAAELARTLEASQPSIIIHCAAERRPDVVQKDPSMAQNLNVSATKQIAEFSAKTGAFLIYISTDYLFNGKRPPYSEFDKPDPLNTYGELKLLGEMAVQGICRNYAILRVPILYGPVEYLGEAAVDAVLKMVLDSSKPINMDDCQRRYPTHVADVSSALNLMVQKYLEDSFFVHGIYHFSGGEMMSKYEMCRVMGEVFGLQFNHLIPQKTVEPSASTNRPHDAHLSCDRLIKLNANRALDLTKFRDGLESLRCQVQK